MGRARITLSSFADRSRPYARQSNDRHVVFQDDDDYDEEDHNDQYSGHDNENIQDDEQFRITGHASSHSDEGDDFSHDSFGSTSSSKSGELLLNNGNNKKKQKKNSKAFFGKRRPSDRRDLPNKVTSHVVNATPQTYSNFRPQEEPATRSSSRRFKQQPIIVRNNVDEDKDDFADLAKAAHTFEPQDDSKRNKHDGKNEDNQNQQEGQQQGEEGEETPYDEVVNAYYEEDETISTTFSISQGSTAVSTLSAGDIVQRRSATTKSCGGDSQTVASLVDLASHTGASIVAMNAALSEDLEIQDLVHTMEEFRQHLVQHGIEELSKVDLAEILDQIRKATVCPSGVDNSFTLMTSNILCAGNAQDEAVATKIEDGTTNKVVPTKQSKEGELTKYGQPTASARELQPDNLVVGEEEEQQNHLEPEPAEAEPAEETKTPQEQQCIVLSFTPSRDEDIDRAPSPEPFKWSDTSAHDQDIKKAPPESFKWSDTFAREKDIEKVPPPESYKWSDTFPRESSLTDCIPGMASFDDDFPITESIIMGNCVVNVSNRVDGCIAAESTLRNSIAEEYEKSDLTCVPCITRMDDGTLAAQTFLSCVPGMSSTTVNNKVIEEGMEMPYSFCSSATSVNTATPAAARETPKRQDSNKSKKPKLLSKLLGSQKKIAVARNEGMLQNGGQRDHKQLDVVRVTLQDGSRASVSKETVDRLQKCRWV